MIKRLLPAGLAARFALLLAAALVTANLVALGLLAFERDRLDREAGAARELERIVALVPAMEALPPRARQQLARQASTRLARITVESVPVVAAPARSGRAGVLEARIGAALEEREVRVAISERAASGRGSGGPARPRGGTIAVSIALQAEEPVWLNVMAAGLRPPDGVRGEVFMLVLGLSLLTVLAVGLWFVRQLTRPLAALAEAAHAAGRGDRGVRVPETGAREMRAAAAAFNDMQGRIARFEAERTRTLAAVGHDLRTPITSLRIRAEMLDEEEGEPMIRTLDEMAVMAEGLVAFAKSGHEAEPSGKIDLAALLQRLCEERGARFEGGGAPPVTGRPVALSRAFGNLVDNAIRYGGSARVRLKQEGGMAVVRVVDEGPGIPEARLEGMFEPFVRGEDSRSLDTGGAGLGLSITRTIIRAHGGEIRLSNRPEGGLEARVELPAG
ncbi:signal transduction histidine kinase [Limimaricola soesokkakensis]|uniref:histidine kinase n=1 Tax=Limimaricola soesokkakensis TaxID=1343159 RepID=A0A1X6ZXV4_9RHOB|nr:ATP-binding protein [Limimaricola soesokkakensis]PSK83546.1 signal transduction histidine kinase [Limimaricola soesokkakensis]SLN64759.1 Osmolarity sensor protein EnvZ [Limimaricola soesokkakensis]